MNEMLGIPVFISDSDSSIGLMSDWLKNRAGLGLAQRAEEVAQARHDVSCWASAELFRAVLRTAQRACPSGHLYASLPMKRVKGARGEQKVLSCQRNW